MPSPTFANILHSGSKAAITEAIKDLPGYGEDEDHESGEIFLEAVKEKLFVTRFTSESAKILFKSLHQTMKTEFGIRWDADCHCVFPEHPEDQATLEALVNILCYLPPYFIDEACVWDFPYARQIMEETLMPEPSLQPQ